MVVVDAAGGAEGAYSVDAQLVPEAEDNCGNGQDDDVDGLADCLDSDCYDDPGCGEICDDGQDNNGDGLPDCMDPICQSEPNCVAPCADEILTPSVSLTHWGDTSGQGDDTTPSCSSSSSAGDWAMAFVAPEDGRYSFDTDGSDYDTVIYMLDECGGQELLCNDDFSAFGTRSSISGRLTAGQRVIVVVDGWLTYAGPFRLNVQRL